MEEYNFGRLLKELRRENNMTQMELSEYLGVGKTAVCNYESGLSIPNSEKLVLISNLFKVSLDYLLGRTDRRGYHALSGQDKLKQDGAAYGTATHIPLFGSITSAELAPEDIEGFIPAPAGLAEAGEYCGLIMADNMLSARGVHKGDILIIQKQDELVTDDIAVVFVEGAGAAIGRVSIDAKSISFLPEDGGEGCTPRRFDLAKTDIKVVGKVVRAVINL